MHKYFALEKTNASEAIAKHSKLDFYLKYGVVNKT